jgi:hypothetical protein
MKKQKRVIPHDPMVAAVNEAMLWMAEDMRTDNPVLTHTLFSGMELNEKAGLKLSKVNVHSLLSYLERTNFITRTEKVGPTGPYFNVHRKVFGVLHPRKRNKDFVRRISHPQVGFCITEAKGKFYRLVCAGRKCKFYFDSEKQCLQGKFFMK